MTQTVKQPKQTAFDKNIVLIIGLLALVGLIIVWAINLQDIESADLNGQTAPDFTLSLFDQFEENEIRLSDLKGQVVVVNFWASWCVECYKEADLLEQTWRDYKDKGIVFIGVDHLDTEKPALEYMAKYDITYPSGPDIGDRISQSYAITGVPETFFIDKEGKIVHVQIGPINHQMLYNLLEELLAQ
ncbi:TlpA disulfide reductase family protein [Anaerolineales bacterium HSG24]|nr:TlpA disulfide reductase family protein [Anaerolineales bacterium HSG24]